MAATSLDVGELYSASPARAVHFIRMDMGMAKLYGALRGIAKRRQAAAFYRWIWTALRHSYHERKLSIGRKFLQLI